MTSNEIWAAFNSMVEAIYASNLPEVLKRQFLTALALDQMYFTETADIPFWISQQPQFLAKQVIYGYQPNTDIRDQTGWLTSREGEGRPSTPNQSARRDSTRFFALDGGRDVQGC